MSPSFHEAYDVLTTVTVPFSVMVIGRSVVTVVVVVSVPVVVVVVEAVVVCASKS